MSQADIQILYYVWAPNSTAAGVADKRKAHLNEHVEWIKGCAAAGTIRELRPFPRYPFA